MVGARGWNADCGEPYQEQYEAPPGETGEKPKPAVENPGTDRPGGEPDRRDQRPRVRGEDANNDEKRKRNKVSRSPFFLPGDESCGSPGGLPEEKKAPSVGLRLSPSCARGAAGARAGELY